MTQMPGRIGPYEVVREIGRGGMGVVFLARDTQLDRDVAIKALPRALAADADRLVRLDREAKTLASLNHPHIASIYGLEEADDQKYLVLEFVDGDTIDELLQQGALPVPDALEIARQIAEAVEAAHAREIVHRDLKPGNVKAHRDADTWVVKVLDFGLAKACPDAATTATDIAELPTVVGGAPTMPGAILGTAGYLSPEQARGRPIDLRSDVFSFGCILYELLTGRCAFGGETGSDCIAAALQTEPDYAPLPPDTPATVVVLLRRCLAKDRHRRLQAIGDARVALEEAIRGETWLDATTALPTERRLTTTVLPWAVCAVLAVALTVVFIVGRRPTAPAGLSRLAGSTVTALPGTSINFRGTEDTWSKIGFSQLVAVSRDGQRLVYTGQRGTETSLYLKDAAEFAPKVVPGTRGARGAFFSPDGEWVGFMSESTVWKVRLPGGTPLEVCELSSAAFDATWLDDGSIVFATDHGLRRVQSGGGEVKELTRVDIDGGERGHCFPHAVAGTDLIIFTLATESGQHAAVLSLGDNTPHVIKRHAMGARYSGRGHLVFARGPEVLAVPYDPVDPRTVGSDEERIVTGVHASPGQGGAVVHLFATSHTGTLVYAPQAATSEPDALMWVDHEGNEEPIVSGEGSWMHQRLSPAGGGVLFNRLTNDGMNDLQIYDVQRDQINPLTRMGHVYDAEWSPDGQTVGFNALDRHGRSINMIPADGRGPAECIFAGTESRPHCCQWSGTTLLFFNRAAEGGLWKSTFREGTWQPLEVVMNSPRREAWARISPDGQLIAYVGFERDGRQVFVQTYPERGALLRVSNDGGGEPLWSHDSRTLYFREAGKIYRTTITTDPVLDRVEPEALPINDIYDAAASGHQHYDLSPDGTRFLMVKHGAQFNPNTVHVLENWPGRLDRPALP